MIHQVQAWATHHYSSLQHQRGWSGADCAERQPCPVDGCSGHGVCLNGHCSCAVGWAGAGCAARTSDTAAAVAGAVAGCERGCSGHGVCSLGVSGVAFCTCALGWAGADCAVAAPCPSGCSGYGVCHYGKCLCAAGSLGADCSQVVTSGSGPFSECADDCSGAGICVNGACECVPGFSGANCLRVDPCPLDCSGRGICEVRATGAACVCAAGYGGLGCDEAVPVAARYEAQGGVVGRAQLVGGVTPCAADCSGRGVCMDDPDGGASCVCAVGYRGGACELENACPSECNLHGVCKDGACICAPGWAGTACDTQAVSPVSREPSCPNHCWGRGSCVADGDSLSCDCDPGYAGEDCSSAQLCADDCSHRGQCVHGTCFCDVGFDGANCSLALACPHGCSGRGDCVRGTCYCEEGYSADDCSVAPGGTLVASVQGAQGLPSSSAAALTSHRRHSSTKKDLVEPWMIVVISLSTLALTFLLGLAFKVVAEQKRRARLIKYIQESDAQAPFVSGELNTALRG